MSSIRNTKQLSTVLILAGTLLIASVWLVNLSLAPRLVLDDAFVYSRYVQTFLTHGELAWNAGEVGTDGFTSFGHLIAILSLTWISGGDPLTVAWLLCLVLGLVSALLAFWLVAKQDQRPWSIVVGTLAAVVFVAQAPFVAYWAHTTMDMTTFGLAVLVSAWCSSRLMAGTPSSYLAAVGLAVGAASAAWVRPEGFLVGLVLQVVAALRFVPWPKSVGFFFRGLSRGVSRKRLAGLVLWFVLSAGYFVGHWVRYGYPFPNPVYVKTAGLRVESLASGATYLWQGPGGGRLPMGRIGFERDHYRQLEHAAVVAAIHPEGGPWTARVFLLLLISTAAASWWHRDRAVGPSNQLWLFYLTPLGLLGLILLSGGDDHYVGWRMMVHVMPVGACAIAWSISRVAYFKARVALVLLLLALLANGYRNHLTRFSRCRAIQSECGLTNLMRPVSLSNYAWDASNSAIDQQVASAIRSAFAEPVRLGQSDYLRIAAHYPGPVVDFSGLVNAELAHRAHPPAFNLFHPADVLANPVDVYFWGFKFLDHRSVAEKGLYDLETEEIIYPWPWPSAQDEVFLETQRVFRGATIRLDDGTYFNFLIHQDALGKLTPGQSSISIEFRLDASNQ